MSEEVESKRCVVYTRKSNENGLDIEYNSLEAQFDACAAYVKSQASKGWHLINRHYDDGGFSGGTTNRPALQQLLKDVADHRIDVVVVYKMDRISRSLSDFMDMTWLFEKNHVSIVSVTQQIDTSTSMGRMIVNLLMSFAQYEREMTSDRIRDKMSASRRRGMWTGGLIPYGYKNENKKLIVDPEHAQEVLYAFEQYAECESYLEVMRRLRAMFGARRDGTMWNLMHVRSLLTQAIPAGKIRDPKTGEIYDGQHEAIVPVDLWLRVQKIITGKRSKMVANRCESNAPLKGLIRCGYCDCSMVPTWGYRGTHRYHYYRCVKTHKHMTENCELRNVGAETLEREVFMAIGKVLKDEFFLQSVAYDNALPLAELRVKALETATGLLEATDSEKKQVAQLLVRRIEARRDGLDIIFRGDGFQKLFKKGK